MLHAETKQYSALMHAQSAGAGTISGVGQEKSDPHSAHSLSKSVLFALNESAAHFCSREPDSTLLQSPRQSSAAVFLLWWPG